MVTTPTASFKVNTHVPNKPPPTVTLGSPVLCSMSIILVSQWFSVLYTCNNDCTVQRP